MDDDERLVTGSGISIEPVQDAPEEPIEPAELVNVHGTLESVI